MAVLRASLLGLGVPGAPRSRCWGERGCHRTHQARKRRLGAGHHADRTPGAIAVRLPVSGLTVRFRAPNGNDDLAILEAVGGAVERALATLPRLTQLAEAANAAHSGGEDTPLDRKSVV